MRTLLVKFQNLEASRQATYVALLLALTLAITLRKFGYEIKSTDFALYIPVWIACFISFMIYNGNRRKSN